MAEAGSMTAAAARLGLTPSAISQTIRLLEDDFGVMLVNRGGYLNLYGRGRDRLGGHQPNQFPAIGNPCQTGSDAYAGTTEHKTFALYRRTP
ncbi:helix-turn-helix domain-containing protein [Brenneria salicis]